MERSEGGGGGSVNFETRQPSLLWRNTSLRDPYGSLCLHLGAFIYGAPTMFLALEMRG